MTGPQGITAQGVSFAYGAKPALRAVSLSVPPGRFCALLGPNGAGKSTLFNLLTGLYVPQAGTITLAGHDLSRQPRAALARLGVVFQAPTFDPDLTVRRNLRYFAALQGLAGRAAEARIDEALERLSMRARDGERARDLNGGHRRRMEIARALIHRPDVLLLDEPTQGLDAASRQAITAHVHGLADQGLAVLWATHLTDEIASRDDVVLLDRGQVVAQGPAGEVGGAGGLAAAYLALTAEGAAP